MRQYISHFRSIKGSQIFYNSISLVLDLKHLKQTHRTVVLKMKTYFTIFALLLVAVNADNSAKSEDEELMSTVNDFVAQITAKVSDVTPPNTERLRELALQVKSLSDQNENCTNLESQNFTDTINRWLNKFEICHDIADRKSMKVLRYLNIRAASLGILLHRLGDFANLCDEFEGNPIEESCQLKLSERRSKYRDETNAFIAGFDKISAEVDEIVSKLDPCITKNTKRTEIELQQIITRLSKCIEQETPAEEKDFTI